MEILKILQILLHLFDVVGVDVVALEYSIEFVGFHTFRGEFL